MYIHFLLIVRRHSISIAVFKHALRDIDDDLLKNPLDQELKSLAQDFGTLLKDIMRTVDRYGLTKYHLHKHAAIATRFLSSTVRRAFSSELAKSYQERFRKSGRKMFTFLDYDGIPWNNNNAEHAVKRFAKYRKAFDGYFTQHSLQDYLVLASVFATCELNNVDVLRFLRSARENPGGVAQHVSGEEPRSQQTQRPLCFPRSITTEAQPAAQPFKTVSVFDVRYKPHTNTR